MPEGESLFLLEVGQTVYSKDAGGALPLVSPHGWVHGVSGQPLAETGAHTATYTLLTKCFERVWLRPEETGPQSRFRAVDHRF
ncbi:MAG: hypothetical protein ACI9B9_001584 [Halioglobus sp.]|jgi:hypothetical protein